MKIYKIYRRFENDYETDIQYKKTIHTATQYFNDLVRKYIKETEFVNEDYFKDEIRNLKKEIKEFYSCRKIVCKKYPVLMYKEVNTLIDRICFFYPSKEGWRIGHYEIVLEEIEILD